jgi:hypothetical protein
MPKTQKINLPGLTGRYALAPATQTHAHVRKTGVKVTAKTDSVQEWFAGADADVSMLQLPPAPVKTASAANKTTKRNTSAEEKENRSGATDSGSFSRSMDLFNPEGWPQGDAAGLTLRRRIEPI